MKEKLEKAVKHLSDMRESILNLYMDSLFEFNKIGMGMTVVDRSGTLHDLDRHITNLQMELKRMEAQDVLNKQNETIVNSYHPEYEEVYHG